MGIGDDIVDALKSGIGSIVKVVMETLVETLKTVSGNVADLLFSIIGDFLKYLYVKIFKPVIKWAGYIVSIISGLVFFMTMCMLISWTDFKYESYIKHDIEKRNSPAYVEYRKTKERYGLILFSSGIAAAVGLGMFLTGHFLKIDIDTEKFNSYQKLKQIK